MLMERRPVQPKEQKSRSKYNQGGNEGKQSSEDPKQRVNNLNDGRKHSRGQEGWGGYHRYCVLYLAVGVTPIHCLSLISSLPHLEASFVFQSHQF